MNRQRADKILAATALAFMLTIAVRYYYPDQWWALALFYTAEAALVGGVADWFAVKALFAKPLGISFHTALVPRNRAKITAAIKELVAVELLAPIELERRLGAVQLAPLVFNALQANRRQWLKLVWTSGALDTTNFISELKQELSLIKLYQYAPILKAWLIDAERIQRLFDRVVPLLRSLIAKLPLRQYFRQCLSELKPDASASLLHKLVGDLLATSQLVDLDAAADALYSRVDTELEKLECPAHPWRQWCVEQLSQTLSELAINPSRQQRLEQHQQYWLTVLLTEVEQLLSQQRHRRWCYRWFSRLVDSGLTKLAENSSAHAIVEPYFQAWAGAIVRQSQPLISTVVGTALNDLSDEALVTFIDSKVGEDLAWIRINGAIIGGIVGLLIFLIGRYLYIPYIWPLLTGL